MRWAVCRAQLAALAGDPGALAMGFVLPVAVYLVFAAIFASATGDELRLRVTLADEAATPLSRRLADALRREPSLRVASTSPSIADAERRVADGEADAAIVLRKDARALDTLAGDGASPIAVLTHPARAVAGGIVAGAVQRAYFAALPDAALRGAVSLVDQVVVPLTEGQRAAADGVLDAMAPEAGTPDPAADAVFSSLVEVVPGVAGAPPASAAAYYAAAVAALFILLSGVPVAADLHEVIRSGAGDRVLAGPAGIVTLVDGRGMFLVVQGVLQASLIFGVSWLGAGVVPSASLAAWALVALALAVCAAGTALLLSAACATGRQATTAGNIAVLVASAVGGSMVPRFLMPAWMQAAGWVTPNAWAIEGFAAAARGAGGAAGLAAAAGVLGAVGLAAWSVARLVFARRAVL